MSKLMSIIINADNRHGYKNQSSSIGEFGEGSLQGVRSLDFLTEGVRNKINYFRGHEIQCILYIDKHSEIEQELMQEMESIVYPCGNNSKIVIKEHDRVRHKWNDYIYLEALKLAEGDYVVHFDQDTTCFRTDECDIVDAYVDLLETYKYICQPWDGVGDKMNHASTRFFICKRETLDFQVIENALHINPLYGKHNPCAEYTLGILAGEGNVLYPPREDEKYIIFSWVKYFSGTLKKLNEMNPEDTLKYIFNLGICGPNDCIDKQP